MPLRVLAGEQALSGARGDLNRRGGERSCWRAVASAGRGDNSGVASPDGLPVSIEGQTQASFTS